MIHKLTAIVAALLTSPLILAGAEPVQLHAKWSVGPKEAAYAKNMQSPSGNFHPNPHLVHGIVITAYDKDTVELYGAVFNPKHPGVTTPNYWRVTASDGKKEEVIPITIEQSKGAKPGEISAVHLVFAKTPKVGQVYKAVPAGGASLIGLLNTRYEIKNEAKFIETPIDSTNLQANIDYVNANKAVEPNISLKSGKKDTATLDLLYGYNFWSDDGSGRFQAKAHIEGTYRPKKNEKYLNKIEGDMEYLWTKRLNYGEDKALSALMQFGFATKIATDQSFDNMDGSVGLSTWFAMNGKAIQSLAEGLCLYGDYPNPAPPVLLNVNYSLVQKLEEDSVNNASRVHDTTHRVSSKIYWSFKLAHGLPLDNISPILEPYDLNVVVNAGIAYDLLEEAFIPETDVSLELSPQSATKSKPSFVLTYQNGKTSTRFENYNALLAGFKLPF